jgi:hypothetical protein
MANENQGSNENNLYNLLGTAATVSKRVSAEGTNYFHIRFATMLKGKPSTVTAMAFGKAHDAIAEKLVEGGEIRLNGYFEQGSEGGRIFTVTGLGREARQSVAA